MKRKCKNKDTSSKIKIVNNALFYLIDSHIHIARIYQNNSILLEKALFFNDQSIHINEEVKEKKIFEQFSNFIHSGFNHIIGGYDHLIFVLGLLLLINNFKLLFLAITTKPEVFLSILCTIPGLSSSPIFDKESLS